jgi:hypothetical protein
MNRFDDLLPEEIEPQHEELISLLKRAYRKSVPLLPMKEAQIIERVREQLMQSGFEDVTTEDIPVPQRGVLDSTPHKSVSPVGILRRDTRRLRLIALLAATLVIAALLVTPLLLLRHASMGETGELPTLTLSSHAALVGDSVTFTLKHVTPSTSVVLTHDIQEPILINGSSSITTDKQGMATFSVFIDKNWRPGLHQIVAEDVVTHNTAIANLQITGQSPAPPPHLLVDSSSIHMGADGVNANTIRLFNLVNSGGGSITWSASSNQSWLLVSPSQGIYSQRQTISLAVQRAGLKPGDYTGNITISSNVSAPLHIEVDMIVRALSADAGAVLALPPALLSFTATDGGPDPSAQSLTISDPGSRPLNWSLAIKDPVTSTTQAYPMQEYGPACRWLSATPHSGNLAPGASRVLTVSVRSQCLLPGTYRGTLQFVSAGANEVTQTVNVSLTVQPHCDLFTSTGYLGFTVVKGQNRLTSQAVSLNTATSCAGGSLSWMGTSSASWLVIPASGQLKDATNILVPVRVNANSLAPGIYAGNIIFTTGQSTLTVMVQLTVQAAPPHVSPIMVASPLTLNFSTIQGQTSPTGQVVTITNNGTSELKWSGNAMPLPSSWLVVSPPGGTIVPGQTGQVTINVNSSQLTPGNYIEQVTLNGVDNNRNIAPGSPQTITVALVVQSPCAISPPSASALSFSAVQGAPANPPSQTVSFIGIGGCAWPVTWNTSIKPTANWLTLAVPGGVVKGSGQSGSIDVGTTIGSLAAGTYSTKVSIAASDASGATVQGSPQSFSVTLTVLPPCVLAPPTPGTLTFTVPQGQSAATALPVVLSESGTCVRPVTWTVSVGSNTWLVLSALSGTDSGSGGSVGVNVTATTLLPGSYSGTITITATDSAGAVLSPQTITVSLTVTGMTISGTVVACPGSTPPTCTAPQALPGATVTVLSGSTTVATTTADASGNYTFSNVALGSYTISVAGYDASNTHYVGSLALTLTGNAINLTVQAFPG